MSLHFYFILTVITTGLCANVNFSDVEIVDTASILQALFANNEEKINDYAGLKVFWANQSLEFSKNDENFFKINLKAYERIEKSGYPAEIHSVTTQDGYILEMHRIPNSPEAPKNTSKRPVLIMHGLLDSSSGFLLNDKENCLPYILADAGYDVWLGNARGNFYSRKHETYNPSGNRNQRRKFWSFSWHEIGVYDLPAMIDYILRINDDFKKIHYIGYSQGTTSFFVMTSERPEYNEKIQMMNALAPVAFMRNSKSMLGRPLAIALSKIEGFLDLIGQLEFLPGNNLITPIGQKICSSVAISKLICRNFLFLLGGFNSRLLKAEKIPEILRYLPAGAGARQIVHYGQLMQSDHFQKYNLGRLKNKMTYGRFDPPNYSLHNITAPVALHYGSNDWFAHSNDVEKLGKLLPNLVGLFKAKDPHFNHFDFIWAYNVRKLIYDDLLILMQKYED